MANPPSENPTYKLIYFNIKGLGEPIRMMFAYGGIKYEDVRIEFSDWLEQKETIPMAQVPVLEIDGQRVHQTKSIMRYLGKQIGLAGENDWENLLIDIPLETIDDMRSRLHLAFRNNDETIQPALFEGTKKIVIPFYLDKLDAIVKENNGYFALGRLTYADIFFVGFLDYVNHMVGFDITENYENLKQVVDNVSSNPSIAEWMEKRPESDY